MAWKSPNVEIPDGNTYNIKQARYRDDGMRIDPKGGYRINFDSLSAFYAEAERAGNTDSCTAAQSHKDGAGRDWSSDGASWSDVRDMATNGWSSMAAKVRAISDRAIQVADKIADELMPQMVYAEYGDEPDMGRYYDGESEYMLDYPFTPEPKEGRVITLVSSVCVSAGVSTQVMVERGCQVAGLAEALTMMGYSVEIIVDISAGKDAKNGAGSLVVKVKEATDNLDMPRIIFALAHPSMLRVLAFMIWDLSTQRAAQGYGYGRVLDPEPRDDGIIMPGVDVRDSLAKDAEAFITSQLERLGLI